MEQHCAILGIDPGVKQCGWAILPCDRGGHEHLLVSGTFIPKRHLRGLDRQLWLLSKLQDVITEHRPAALAYEEFTWRSGDDTAEHYVLGRPDMERFIGGIQCLSLFPPFPVLMGLLPQQWGKQLFGHPSHTKAQIAFAVNARLGTDFKGDHFDNHACDAAGIALVASDLLQQRSRLDRSAEDARRGKK